MLQAYAIAAAGLTAATERFADSARRTAQAPFADPAGEIVERIGARIAVEANAAVLRAADETAGALLDLLA